MPSSLDPLAYLVCGPLHGIQMAFPYMKYSHKMVGESQNVLSHAIYIYIYIWETLRQRKTTRDFEKENVKLKVFLGEGQGR